MDCLFDTLHQDLDTEVNKHTEILARNGDRQCQCTHTTTKNTLLGVKCVQKNTKMCTPNAKKKINIKYVHTNRIRKKRWAKANLNVLYVHTQNILKQVCPSVHFLIIKLNKTFTIIAHLIPSTEPVPARTAKAQPQEEKDYVSATDSDAEIDLDSVSDFSLSPPPQKKKKLNSSKAAKSAPTGRASAPRETQGSPNVPTQIRPDHAPWLLYPLEIRGPLWKVQAARSRRLELYTHLGIVYPNYRIPNPFPGITYP